MRGEKRKWKEKGQTEAKNCLTSRKKWLFSSSFCPTYATCMYSTVQKCTGFIVPLTQQIRGISSDPRSQAKGTVAICEILRKMGFTVRTYKCMFMSNLFDDGQWISGHCSKNNMDPENITGHLHTRSIRPRESTTEWKNEIMVVLSCVKKERKCLTNRGNCC